MAAFHEPAVCMESKPAVYRVCTPCPPQSTPCPNGQIKDSIDSVIVRKTDSLGILESVGKPTPVHYKSGGGINRLEPATATKLFNIKGVGLVAGTSYEDAEKKVKEKRESYLAKKGGL
jgi:hypothetical protein